MCDLLCGLAQYVFALTRGQDGLVGGHLFRSDAQGKGDTWDDRTNEMQGQQLWHPVLSSAARLRPMQLCGCVAQQSGGQAAME